MVYSTLSDLYRMCERRREARECAVVRLALTAPYRYDACVRAIVQRVSRAEVRIGGRTAGAIGGGFVVLVGVSRVDGEADAAYLVDRNVGVRVFAAAAGQIYSSI